ncbi:MAG: hypothetical protein EOS58_20780 [Mesorhizobium sp.]|nr:hypothetical protein EOA33_10540 [Mesorhizobium sp. M4A.F.Ca.ET.050.02.1.1]RVD37811.1 hypothetical protein EN742_19270 [Mesorhizobium sp. M4A.F.Ca.ET.020.02.1.1]RVD73822.1 hypothetical protein EN751_02885 [Mesorhizobium sp. M4A.F.Ca.ET.029.04.2.1]RWD02647.1 MAG: hypothetical protein EOS58_20780 [Mesorhizobium sp.]RWD33784.1 MAG: hypothetical protein EOS33_11050 [Mesorhizobium sp.]
MSSLASARAPPSALPGISPSRGEIGYHLGFRKFSASQGMAEFELLISPLEGRWPAGQRGVLGVALPIHLVSPTY